MKDLRRTRDSLVGRVPASAVLIGTGVVLFTISLWNFEREVGSLARVDFPLAAFVLTGGLSLCVVYVGYRLRESEYEPEERLSVTGWAFLGLAVTVLLQATTLAIRAAEGRPIGEPQFPLLVVGSVGALAGYGIGRLLVDVRRTAAHAREARDGMAFSNSLLRHDVGNALQVLLGQVDLLKSVGNDEARAAADRIERQVNEIQELTRSVDAVTSVLTGEATPEPRNVVEDLDAATGTVADTHPDATVETELDDRMIVLGTDALQPVFNNLLHNAVEHTGPEPTVRVTSDIEGDTAVVRIADDGPGIPPEERDRIFQRGITSDGGSGGLGLHIVSTLVERSGGSIRVEDSDLGGAAFVVSLPLAEE